MRTGGCQCGAVRYAIGGAPLALYVCHCRECQKQSASAFGISLEVAPSAKEELLRRGFSREFGARRLASALESVCNVEISKILRRDDRSSTEDRAPLIAWLREIRAGSRPFDPEEVRRRVNEAMAARLDYNVLRIDWSDGAFSYLPDRGISR